MAYELDNEVFRKVFGWEWVPLKGWDRKLCPLEHPPQYFEVGQCQPSLLLDDAWRIVENWGNRVAHGESFELLYDGQWTAIFSENHGASVDEDVPERWQATADTATEAICRARLKACV